MWRPPPGSYLANPMSEPEEPSREGRSLRSGKFVASTVDCRDVGERPRWWRRISRGATSQRLRAATETHHGGEELRAAQDALAHAKEDAERDLDK